MIDKADIAGVVGGVGAVLINEYLAPPNHYIMALAFGAVVAFLALSLMNCISRLKHRRDG